MESVEILLDLITNHHSDVPIPGCLTHCINLELFHCKVRIIPTNSTLLHFYKLLFFFSFDLIMV